MEKTPGVHPKGQYLESTAIEMR